MGETHHISIPFPAKAGRGTQGEGDLIMRFLDSAYAPLEMTTPSGPAIPHSTLFKDSVMEMVEMRAPKMRLMIPAVPREMSTE